MNSSGRNFREIDELIELALEGSISQEQCERLNDWIINDPVVLRHYCQYIQLTVCIERLSSNISESEMPQCESICDRELWDQLARQEKTAPEVTVRPEHLDLIQKVVYPPKVKRRISKVNIFLFLSSAAVLVVALFARLLVPQPGVEVATLAESINAKWANAERIEIGQRFATGSTNILLREGCAELIFDNNARITVEGPAEFQILTGDQIGLNYGRVYATVPEQAYGFTVSTSNGKIIDLGTEFGVQRDPYGNTELHVIKGRTNLIANTQSNRININVAEGDARKLSALTGEVETIALQKDLFVRKIDSKSNLIWKGQTFIDLADVVGGGNGLLQGQIAGSIDPATGDIHSKAFQQNGRISGDSYKTVPGRQFIDGVFVPGVVAGPGVVSSAGHKFEFPKTSGIYFSDITSSPQVLRSDIAYTVYPVYLNRDEAATLSHPLILIHANAGITFDLNSMRRSLPNLKIDRFTAQCGVSKSLDDMLRSEFWVLLDGVCVSHHVFDRDHSEIMELDIPIAPDQKFLTLATTDAGDGYTLDWCLFEQPKLHLANSE